MSVVCLYVCAPYACSDWRVHKRALGTPKTGITLGTKLLTFARVASMSPHWIVSSVQKLGSLLRIKKALKSIHQCTSQQSLKDTEFQPHMGTSEMVVKEQESDALVVRQVGRRPWLSNKSGEFLSDLFLNSLTWDKSLASFVSHQQAPRSSRVVQDMLCHTSRPIKHPRACQTD